jgi:hypothetical protein
MAEQSDTSTPHNLMSRVEHAHRHVLAHLMLGVIHT